MTLKERIKEIFSLTEEIQNAPIIEVRLEDAGDPTSEVAEVLEEIVEDVVTDVRDLEAEFDALVARVTALEEALGLMVDGTEEMKKAFNALKSKPAGNTVKKTLKAEKFDTELENKPNLKRLLNSIK